MYVGTTKSIVYKGVKTGATWTIKSKNDLAASTVTLDTSRLVSDNEITMNVVAAAVCQTAGSPAKRCVIEIQEHYNGKIYRVLEQVIQMNVNCAYPSVLHPTRPHGVDAATAIECK